MNILLVSEYCFANPDFARLSKELAKRDHDVAIATSLRPTDSVPKDQGKNMFQIQPFITLYSIPHTLSFPFSKMYRIVKEKRIQVIHALNDHSTNVAIAALVSRMAGVPFVYTIQGPGTRTGNWLVDTIVKIYDLTAERWNAKQAKRIILLSKSLNSTAKKLRVKESKATIIPSGMDQERFDPKRSDIARQASLIKQRLNVKGHFVAGFVGRLVSAKGLTYLLSAAKEVQKNHSDIVVLIVGDGPQRTELETLAADLGIKVIFAGWQSDPRPFYSIMDVFVLPSFFEGLPNVVLEAMAMSKPVIATKVGGNLDVIANGENGFLVRIRDSHQLASALTTLIENEDVRHRMGMANREKIVTLFQWSRAVEEIEKVYNEISKADLASSVTGQ